MTETPSPPKDDPSRRLLRPSWGLIAAVAAGVAAFLGLNLLAVQNQVCSLPFLSDVCGASGFGERPTREERLAWPKVRPGSCADLREHLRRFPDGVYSGAANNMLAARRLETRIEWTAEEQRQRLFVGGEEASPSSTLEEAKQTAIARGQAPAEEQCRGFESGGQHRFVSAVFVPGESDAWDCNRLAGGHICGVTGWAVCQLKGRSEVLYETCGHIH
jgi:hypothetical protein